MKKSLSIFMVLFSVMSFAASDTGTISELYIEEGTGHMAIKLKDGFPSSRGLCTNNSGWAGISNTSPELLKSVLLAAKISQSTVSISITDCHEAYPSWLKINSVYIK